jgi:hypothetical protein
MIMTSLVLIKAKNTSMSTPFEVKWLILICVASFCEPPEVFHNKSPDPGLPDVAVVSAR